MAWPKPEDLKFDCLRGLILQAENAEPVAHYRFNSVTQHCRFDNINGPPGRVFLYMFQISQGQPDEVRSAFLRHKESGRTYLSACPKRDNRNCSNILYVGSSTTGISARLRQHVGSRPTLTYALKLENWFWFHPTWQVDIWVRGYDGLSREAMQILEDTQSDTMNPLFGKRGSNGR